MMARVARETLAGTAAQHAVCGPAAACVQRDPSGQRLRPSAASHGASVPTCWTCPNNDIPCWNRIRFIAPAHSVEWWACEQTAPPGGSFREPGGRFSLIR
jgi:hypothetical protein